jgi:SAM-dependent methyltransferase
LKDASRDFEARDLIEVMDEAHNYNDFLVGQLQRWCARYRRVLDFGAGNGRFTFAVRENGHEVVALEPDSTLRNAIHARGVGVATSLADLKAAPPFDGVYSLNVLEHIEDDHDALARLRSLLRPGGGLFLYVPAFPILYSANDRRVGHFRRYRRASLSTLLTSAGFSVTRAEYVDFCGFGAALAYKVIGDANGDLSIGAVRFYDRFVFPVSRTIDRATSRIAGKNLLIEAIVPNLPSRS